jgi:hypothetical protein
MLKQPILSQVFALYILYVDTDVRIYFKYEHATRNSHFHMKLNVTSDKVINNESKHHHWHYEIWMNANLILKTQQITGTVVSWQRLLNIFMTQYICHWSTVPITKAISQNV